MIIVSDHESNWRTELELESSLMPNMILCPGSEIMILTLSSWMGEKKLKTTAELNVQVESWSWHQDIRLGHAGSDPAAVNRPSSRDHELLTAYSLFKDPLWLEPTPFFPTSPTTNQTTFRDLQFLQSSWARFYPAVQPQTNLSPPPQNNRIFFSGFISVQKQLQLHLHYHCGATELKKLNDLFP